MKFTFNDNNLGRWTKSLIAFGIAIFCYMGFDQILNAASPNSGIHQEIKQLKGSIEFLSSSFPKTYPNGELYLLKLAELKKLTDTGSEVIQDFRQLQREVLLANPLISGQPLLFVARHQYARDHHNTATFFPCAANEYNDGKFTPGSALKVIDDVRSGIVRTLIDMPQGVIRDPEIHFDGTKIIFSMRTNIADSYHLYEIQTDGSGFRQLTFAKDVDDLDPLYLPDGGIMFSSTREPKYCMCNRHIMANLFRMDADGANIFQIGKSTLFEGHSSLLEDGRILYDRWEYVDRNFGDAQALWTVNPDGTSHSVYWGNNTASPGAVIDGRAIPGTDRVICVLSSCHDRPWGALGIIDRNLGLDGRVPITRTWPANSINLVKEVGWELFDAFTQVSLKYEDPFPLSDHFFLCSRMTGKEEQMGLFLLDLFGNEILIHSENPGCYDPMPIKVSVRPPALPIRRDFEGSVGYFYITDVYQGTHMQGVKRGSVRALRVVESPEKRFWTLNVWGGQGIEGPAMNWHDFNNKRILGTVPVEADGSVYFAVPSERFVYFQLLDENGMMIQSMRSGTMVQSGEIAGCAGCHEDRRIGPAMAASEYAKPPVGRKPQQLTEWHGPAREFSYLQEVQPVLNKHCVRCHDFGTDGGKKLILAADRDLTFNVSYNELWRKKYIKVMGAGPAQTQPAYSWGSHASKLGQTLLKNYKDRLSREEFERIVTWIDLNAPYYPTYACAYPDNLAGRSPLNNSELESLEKATGIPFRQLASHSSNRGPQICFDRPELSPCLTNKTVVGTESYTNALNIIQKGKKRLEQQPEADMPGFIPSGMDQWRHQKYQARQQWEIKRREALKVGKKVYDIAN